MWWLGILIAIAALAVLAVGYASLAVRRLHDMNFSGYHAIWVAPLQLLGAFVPAALTSEGVDTSRYDDATFYSARRDRRMALAVAGKQKRESLRRPA